MTMSDPIADFLTRLRNAIKANKRRVELPSSNMKVAIAELLKKYGYIYDFEVIPDNKQNVLRILLRYRRANPLLQV
jgi:SSU ribosomal protein S8P